MDLSSILREGAISLVPAEYHFLGKMILFAIMSLVIVFSFIKTIKKNRKNKKHLKSATVKVIKNLFLYYILYGILFVDILPTVFTGIVFLACLIFCSIHWKSTKCKDFPDFFAVKSGWLTSFLTLSIGQFLVGSIYENILGRVFIVSVLVGALWLICLIYTLIGYKHYYAKNKAPTPKPKPNPNPNTNILPAPNDNAQNSEKTPSTEEVQQLTEETGTYETVADRISDEGGHYVAEDESPVTEYVNSIIDNIIPVETIERLDKTLKPQLPPIPEAVNGNIEDQIRKQMISKALGYIKFYFEKRANEELVGNMDSIEEMDSFDPSDFENIEIDINFNPTFEEQKVITETNEVVTEAEEVTYKMSNDEKITTEEQPKVHAMLTLNLDEKPKMAELYLDTKKDEDKK